MMEDLLFNIGQKLKNVSHNYTAKYNVFDVLGVSRKEVIMTRFLADLLNPAGSHDKGDIYLKAFFENVLKIPYVPQGYLVMTEYPIDSRRIDRDSLRRIDIVIIGENTFIPIEVKIDAEDQELQCSDYYDFAVDKGGDKLFYLTKDGKSPSENSLGELAKNGAWDEKIKLISFKYDIVNWLDEIITKEEDKQLRVTLIQYKDAIERFSGVMDREERKEIKKCILENADTFRAAIGIAETINEAKLQLLKNVFYELSKAIECRFDNIICETGFTSKSFQEKISTYYDKKGSSHPSLRYVINGKLLEISVDWNLYAGAEDGRWVYLPSGTQSKSGTYNFHDMNEEVIALLTDGAMDDFVDNAIGALERFINSLK